MKLILFCHRVCSGISVVRVYAVHPVFIQPMSVCLLHCFNIYFMWCDLPVLSWGISMKLGTNIHHVSGHCWKGSQGQRPRVKVMSRLNHIMIEACRSTECHRGPLVIILVLHYHCNMPRTVIKVSVLHILGKSNGYIRSDHEEAFYNTPENVGDLSTWSCITVLLVLLPLQHWCNVTHSVLVYFLSISDTKLYYSWQKQWSVRIFSIFVHSSSLSGSQTCIIVNVKRQTWCTLMRNTHTVWVCIWQEVRPIDVDWRCAI